MWRKSGTKLQGRYPATYAGDFLGRLGEFVFMAKSNLNLTIWLVQMHSKLASLVRNNIWTCQIVKFALDFAKNTNPSRPSINPPVGVAGSVLIYIFGFLTLLMQLCHQLLDIPHHPNPTKINFYDFIFWKKISSKFTSFEVKNKNLQTFSWWKMLPKFYQCWTK